MKKHMRTFSFLLLCLLLQNVLTAQNKNILVVTHYECYKNEEYSKILVTSAEAKIEEIPLSNFRPENIEMNQVAFTKVITKHRNSGYKIISETCGDLIVWGGFNVLKTTVILEKE